MQSFTFLIAIFLFSGLCAQEVKTEVVEYNGLKYPSYVKEVNATPDLVEKAIKDRFASLGLKPREHRGFIIYRNVVIPDIGITELSDIHIKVSRKGNRNSTESIINAIVTQPGTINEQKPDKEQKAIGSGASLGAGGMAFLNSLTPNIDNQLYLKELTDQEDLVKRAEKKLKDLENEEKSLESKLSKVKEELLNQRKETANAQATLEAIRQKKAGDNN